MTDSSDALAWAARAEEDYMAATVLMRRKRPLAVSTCFHAQQCVEKYMKALLTARQHAFPRTHDLRILNDLCRDADILLEIAPDRLDTLSYFAVQTRYPGEEPTMAQVLTAVETAQAVRRFARKWLGIL